MQSKSQQKSATSSNTFYEETCMYLWDLVNPDITQPVAGILLRYPSNGLSNLSSSLAPQVNWEHLSHAFFMF